jgi:hypothetical protein
LTRRTHSGAENFSARSGRLGRVRLDDFRAAFDVYDHHRTAQGNRHFEIARRVEIFHHQSVIEGEAFNDRRARRSARLRRFISRVVHYSKSFDLQFEFSRNWILTGNRHRRRRKLVGALYPAWRASAIDPVEVMVNLRRQNDKYPFFCISL